MASTREPWDAGTLDVAFDRLHEATNKPNPVEASRIAFLISSALRHDGLSLAPFLNEAWGELENASCTGAALAMFRAIFAHARKTDDLPLFRRLLASPRAAKALSGTPDDGLLSSAFLAALVDAAREATPEYRYGACGLLSHQSRVYGLELEPLKEFLFSCLTDEPNNPRESSARLAGWLIDEHVRRGRDREGAWRAELDQRAVGRAASALVALRSQAKLAALEADPTRISALLAERGARLDATLEGVSSALRVTADDEREAFAARICPLLTPIVSRGSAKQKKAAASLLESLAAKPRARRR